MNGRLRIIDGPNVGACFVLEGRTRVGRASDSDIQLDEPSVSRHHAGVRRQADGSYELSDLGSTSGTSVNGVPIRKTVLQPDDVIAIGRSRFSFETGTDATTDACFSNKAKGFAALRPTLPGLPIVTPTPAPAVARKRRRTTQRRIPAVRDASPIRERPAQVGGAAEGLLETFLGPDLDAVVPPLGVAANEHRDLTHSAPAPTLYPDPLGIPSAVCVTESGSIVSEFDPEALESALSTLRDVLDYRTLRLDGLRGKPMDGHAKARYAQLSTRLLADTHGLPSSRRFVRESCRLPATLTQCDGGFSRTLEVSLDDLSAGGTRLSMFDPSVRVGDEVWVAFDLAALFSSGQKVVFRSRVVWTRPHIGATGLMFGGNARFVDTVEAAIATG